MENTYKIGNQGAKRKGFFAMIDGVLGLEKLFQNGVPIQLFPKVVFITALVVFYIGLTHQNENKIRRVNKLEKQVEDLRADYTTLKADYMFDSKQSEVAKKVKKMGLKESTEPPFKIEYQKGEY
ncbi:MAG: FtsL-like putative cell division protein [Bacteroidota bacterium]